jgi:hypothetical protein
VRLDGGQRIFLNEDGTMIDRGSVLETVVGELDVSGGSVVKSLQLGKDECGTAWFVDRVTIHNLQNNTVQDFEVGKWIGRATNSLDSLDMESHITCDTFQITNSNWGRRSAEKGEAATAAKPATPRLKVETGRASIPRFEKVMDGMRAVVKKKFGHGGEDAYLVLPPTSTARVALLPSVAPEMTEAELQEKTYKQLQNLAMQTGACKANIKAADIVHALSGFYAEAAERGHGGGGSGGGEGHSHSCVLAVADGVGTWANKGIDSGAFSRRLMLELEAAWAAALQQKGQADDDPAPMEVLSAAADRYCCFVLNLFLLYYCTDISHRTCSYCSTVLVFPTELVLAMLVFLTELGLTVLVPLTEPVLTARVAEHGTQGSTTVCMLTVDTRDGLLTSVNLGDSGFVVVRDGPPPFLSFLSFLPSLYSPF